MTKIEWKKSIGIAGARVLLAFVFLFSQAVWAVQKQQTKDKSDSQQKTTVQRTGEQPSSAPTTAKQQTEEAQGEVTENAVVEKTSDDASHQSIKVHGHWTIEVRNPDGTLVTHREFNNRYVGSCAVLSSCNVLPEILARTITVGTFQVDLNSCGNADCLLTEGSNLNTAYVASNTVYPQFVLSGSATASGNNSIFQVTTSFYGCAPSVAPASCNASNSTNTYVLTVAQLSSSIAVSANQTIAVTVVISFG